jgi:acetyltransferase-like isoleucine patch superfamily enzyme
MINVIIVGSGAVAAEITSYIEDQNRHIEENKQLNILGYLDFEENKVKYWARYKLKMPVIADVYSYKVNKDDHFIIGIADILFREKMIETPNLKGAKIIGFIHHTAIIANSAVIGSGNIIYPHCIIGPNTIIGNNNLLTAYSFISHDCKIGDNNFFSTAGLSGNVKIGNNNFFGIRATVLPNISIGDRNTIQAGMIVDKILSDGNTIFHRFKEKIIAIPK